MKENLKKLKSDFASQTESYNVLRVTYRSTIIELIKAILKKNSQNISFHDKNGFLDELDCNNGRPYVTYDGGNHPEYASNAYSEVSRVFLSEEKIYVVCEECDEYSVDRIYSIEELSFLAEVLVEFDEYDAEDENFDVNARFQNFRDSLTGEVLEMVRKAGGRIDLKGGSVALEFSSARYLNDVLGEVKAISLAVYDENPDCVIFHYVTPEWCEDNSDYIGEGDDETEHEVALDELSANELYNILKLI